MSEKKKSHLKPKFGSFILAVTAYITGVLLFSFWSYFSHQNIRIDQMDETLLDATFSVKELLGTDGIATLPNGSAPGFGKQQGLTRLARHGAFSSVAVISIDEKKITPLIVGLNSSPAPTAVDTNRYPIPPDVEMALLRLATAGTDDVNLFTTTHPEEEDIRYAIRFKAEHKGCGIAFLVAQERTMLKEELADQAWHLFAAGLGMLFLATPLISLFNRTRKKAEEELSSMNISLHHDIDQQQSREEELKDAISDLERFNAVSAGRESRIIELKAEVNELLQQLKREKCYNIDKID